MKDLFSPLEILLLCSGLISISALEVKGILIILFSTLVFFFLLLNLAYKEYLKYIVLFILGYFFFINLRMPVNQQLIFFIIVGIIFFWQIKKLNINKISDWLKKPLDLSIIVCILFLFFLNLFLSKFPLSEKKFIDINWYLILFLTIFILIKSVDFNPKIGKRIILILSLIFLIWFGRVTYAFYFYHQGEKFRLKNQFDLAIKSYEKARNCSSFPSKLFIHLQKLYFSQKKYQEVIDIDEKYRSGFLSSTREMETMLATSYIKTLNWDKALSYGIENFSSEHLSFNDFILITQKLLERNKGEDALELLRRIEAKDEKQKLKLIEQWFNFGLWETIVKFYREENLNKTNIPLETLKQIGIAYFENGQNEKAQKIFEKLLLKKTKDIGILHFLGMIAEGKGENREAIKYYEKIIRIDPTYAYINLSLDSLYTSEGLKDKSSSFLLAKNKKVKILSEREDWQGPWPNGVCAQTGEYWVKIRVPQGKFKLYTFAWGDKAVDVWPIMEIYLDGEKIATYYVNTGRPKYYPIKNVQNSEPSEHKLSIYFVNDYSNPELGLDRNLYIDKIYLVKE